ncbi:hypothetical protein M5M_16785 [Simiduia agarivorans SA1 = DSM 21679]|uniref:Cellobiose 2-epimerase n=2 Tax=Simiduia TaxID=447467 RepID=K4L2R1_SIMAS|nr:hypothetical protein M5M_16785 [Simiduia agarivorans SA1 = DSM 21679]
MACEQELENILAWWRTHTLDSEGFVAELDNNGQRNVHAEKGIILNTRILWFFSELAIQRPALECGDLADRAFDYLTDHFFDEEYGGLFWSLDAAGQMCGDKKQTYAQAFGIYALSAYYRLTKKPEALAFAMDLFRLIEQHCLDRASGGYVEAKSRQWEPLVDVRLSAKDDNAPKTMNNHLHVLEAYTGLYLANPTRETEQALRNNILWMCERIADADTGHLKLFLDMQWNDHSSCYSYGHDIEASWLICEALEVLGDEVLLNRFSPLVVNLAKTCLAEGIGEHGQVLDKFDKTSGERHPESEWWVQAEAMVGFVNAWQLTGDEKFLRATEAVWVYIQQYQLDKNLGEWFWYSTLDQARGHQHYKMGFWKAPYHNGRAMLEVANRLSAACQKSE